jgi:hypothetical protein
MAIDASQTGGLPICDHRAMQSSRLLQFVARWAIMSGLAGTVFAALVFAGRNDASTPNNDQGLLLAAAALLSVAFILAPFVRKAFAGPPRAKPADPKRRTLLDEMRERAEADDTALESAPQAAERPKQSATAVSRALIALYVVFGGVLVAVLWSMG